MRFYSKLLLVTSFLALATIGQAQPPREKEQPGKESRQGRPEGRPGPGGPGGGFQGGRGGFGFGQPGQILPPMLVEQLKLTEDQKKELAKLQKETEEKLDKLLSEEQRLQLKELRERGGRPGGDRGRPGAEGGRPGERPQGARPVERPQGEGRPNPNNQ